MTVGADKGRLCNQAKAPLPRKKDQPVGRRSLARTPAPFNFRDVPIKSKDGVTQIVKEPEEDDHAKSPSRKEA